ncbi:MAG TPA: CDP-archaeol synthase [Alphaproteobacteria bacterium]|nr:CDP-archaeol synthase [Alphaproteobacteria bacterium]
MNEILLVVLQSVYLLVPAYFANMAPPIFKKLKLLKSLDRPIDGNKKLGGKPIFGKNKTYRGFLSGILFGIAGAYLQMILFSLNLGFFKSISIPGIDYTSHVVVILLGFLLGFGALAGDLVESFFKRRIDIPSGGKFIPWDQIDHTIGAYLFILPLLAGLLSWQLFASSIIVGFFLHVIVNHISFYIGIRKEKW